MEYRSARMLKPKIQALIVGILAYAIVSAILLFLSACSTIIPLGGSGEYGSVKLSADYYPPIDFYEKAQFIPDKL